VPFPAAVRALTDFPAILSRRRGPGEQVWVSRFTTNPLRGAHSADTLADFAAVLGSRLFPFGSEHGDSIFAVDEQGRVFALDQAGEWFLGSDVDAALTTLLLGRDAPRVRDDGTW
ncbi:SUKH-3 domain-containing protein, partial [Micromonospora azadirachtae]